MLMTGEMTADDATYSTDERDEDPVVEALKQKQWGKLADYIAIRPALKPLLIERRFGLRWIDGVRAKLPRGDRG
ncbi:hypothetical protein D3C77_685480 [compost metagenome]